MPRTHCLSCGIRLMGIEKVRCDDCKRRQAKAARRHRKTLKYKSTIASYLADVQPKRTKYMATWRDRQKQKKLCQSCTQKAMRCSVFCRTHRDRFQAAQNRRRRRARRKHGQGQAQAT